MTLSSCAPLSDSKEPEPPEPQPDISVNNPLYGPHFIHFEMTVNKTITTNLEVGFLISGEATAPQNPVSKQGYISRTFSSSTPKRQLFLFMHDATAYTETDVENTFTNADFLQEDTNYYLHIFNGSLSIEPQAFKTMSYETLNAAGNFIAALDGLGHTDAASITRTIERKAGELTIFPAAIFGGNYATSRIRTGSTDVIFCAYTTQACTSVFGGLQGYPHYQSDVNYYTMLVGPNTQTATTTWTLLTGTLLIYMLQINTITE
ncbi:hypothetical protein P0082_09755 [Candidatus Haliotispira prima]|uniref:Lipoprotein n=1 Tax=Candidatus Haliotispira prima TaxID=3034016 RepID=A0ABY8MFI7_9SPIO|nr:hypothetical protein P0082_09755 [Candidatus Haliotispira prima]